MRLVWYNIILFVFLFSCVKDKPVENNSIPSNIKDGILVLNEGSFGNNNADFSFINKDFTGIQNKLFEQANSFIIGDVMQDAVVDNENIYATINASNKVVILNSSNFKLKKEIGGVISPRYILNLQNKLYVSSYATNNIYVISKSGFEVERQIKLDYFGSEQMLLFDNYAYVCQWDTACNYVYKINTLTDVVESKIQIAGKAAHSLVIDKNSKLWVLSGNKYKNTNSYLTCINLTNGNMEKQFQFNHNIEPIKLCTNTQKDKLYFIQVDYLGNSINNGICQMSIEDTDLPEMPIINAPTGTYYWGLNIQPVSDYIFISNPKGFVQQSEVEIYDANAKPIYNFNAGIGANRFLFL